jgi:hypothetical protein
MFDSRRVNRRIAVNSSVSTGVLFGNPSLPRVQLRVLRSVSCGLRDQGGGVCLVLDLFIFASLIGGTYRTLGYIRTWDQALRCRRWWNPNRWVPMFRMFHQEFWTPSWLLLLVIGGIPESQHSTGRIWGRNIPPWLPRPRDDAQYQISKDENIRDEHVQLHMGKHALTFF